MELLDAIKGVIGKASDLNQKDLRETLQAYSPTPPESPYGSIMAPRVSDDPEEYYSKYMGATPSAMAYTRAVPWAQAMKTPGLRVLPGEINKFRKFLTEAAKKFGTDYSIEGKTGIAKNMENISFIDSKGGILGGRSMRSTNAHHGPLIRNTITDDPSIVESLVGDVGRLTNDYQVARFAPPYMNGGGVSVELPMNMNRDMHESIKMLSKGRPTLVDLTPYEDLIESNRGGGWGIPGKTKDLYPQEDLHFVVQDGGRGFSREYLDRVKAYESWLEKQIGSAQFNKLYRR